MSATFRHQTPIQIRFNDLDAYNHVNNNVYAAYYDLGKESYFAETLRADFYTLPVACLMVHIEFDFIEPIRYGDRIAIETRISRIGNKSFTLEQQAVNLDNHHVVSRGVSVMACIDSKTQQGVSVPDYYREAFEAYEGGVL